MAQANEQLDKSAKRDLATFAHDLQILMKGLGLDNAALGKLVGLTPKYVGIALAKPHELSETMYAKFCELLSNAPSGKSHVATLARLSEEGLDTAPGGTEHDLVRAEDVVFESLLREVDGSRMFLLGWGRPREFAEPDRLERIAQSLRERAATRWTWVVAAEESSTKTTRGALGGISNAQLENCQSRLERANETINSINEPRLRLVPANSLASLHPIVRSILVLRPDVVGSLKRVCGWLEVPFDFSGARPLMYRLASSELGLLTQFLDEEKLAGTLL